MVYLEKKTALPFYFYEKSLIKKENSFDIGVFLENFRAIKQSSSQHTIFFLVHSTKPRKSKMPVPVFFFQDRPWVI